MALRTMVRSHPLIATLVVLVLFEVLMEILPGSSDLFGMTVKRVGLFALAIGFLVFIGGREMLAWRGVGFSLRKCIYPLVLALIIGAVSCVGIVNGELSISPYAAPALLMTVLLYLFVGLYEETLYRGIVQEGLMAAMGRSRKGIIGAAAIAGLLFGFVHVIGDIPAMMTDSTALANGIGKTITTGEMGFLLGIIYLKTRSLWGVVFVHALNDIFPSIREALTMGFETASIAYVQTGIAGEAGALFFLVLAVLQIPFIVIGLRILKTVDLSTYKNFLTDK